MSDSSKYSIADFIVSMNCKSEYMKEIISDYAVSADSEVEIDLCYSKEDADKYRRSGMNFSEFEYNFTINTFFNRIIEKDAFCFHASTLSVDGEAILFSANSGTGKSTHTRLWKEYMKDHEVINLNDDKPIIRFVDGKAIAYGSPWCGKHTINCNKSAPVKALVFLERGEHNSMERVDSKEVFSLLFPQTFGGKKNPQQLAKLLELLDRFVQDIDVYRLHCNISEEAVRLVYDTVWKGDK